MRVTFFPLQFPLQHRVVLVYIFFISIFSTLDCRNAVSSFCRRCWYETWKSSAVVLIYIFWSFLCSLVLCMAYFFHNNLRIFVFQYIIQSLQWKKISRKVEKCSQSNLFIPHTFVFKAIWEYQKCLTLNDRSMCFYRKDKLHYCDKMELTLDCVLIKLWTNSYSCI